MRKMDLQLKLLLLKFFSLVCYLIFLALGISLGGAGLWLLFDPGNFLSGPLEHVQLVAVCFALIGVMVIPVSIMGCLSVTKENRILLQTNLFFLVVLMFGQIFVILLLMLNRQPIQRTLDQTVDAIIIKYGADGTPKNTLLDKVQSEGSCCGRTGRSDWLANLFVIAQNESGPHVLPCSCFSFHEPNTLWCSDLQNLTSPLIGAGNSSYTEGCDQQLRDWLQNNIVTFVGMDFGVLLVQLILLVLTGLIYLAVTQRARLMKISVPSDIQRLVVQ